VRGEHLADLGQLQPVAGTGRKLFTGGAADYAGDIRALAEVGVTAFDFGLFGPTLAATLDNMRRFKDEVMAKVQ